MSNYWQASYSHKDFEIISKNVEYDGHFKVLDQKLRFRMFSGGWSQVVNREIIIHRAVAVVLLYNPEEDAVVLIEQFRPGAVGHNDIDSPWLLEPVAGLIEIGDSPEETARREVEEEAGCTVLDLIPICQYLPSQGISNEIVYVFCGKINNYSLDSFHGLIGESEDIKSHILPVEVAFKLLENNKIVVATGIITLQWLKINIQIIRKQWKNT